MEFLVTKKQYKLFLEEVSSIPTYKNVNVVRNFFDKLKKEFPSTPEYVLNDIIESLIVNNPEELKWVKRYFRGEPSLALSKWWKTLLRGPWNLKIIEVNPEDFNDTTVEAFIERDFGGG